MNKLFATFVLLFSTVCFLQAQDGYIKFHTDSAYRKNTIKVFKGEILPFVNASKPNKIDLIIGVDTITDLGSTSKAFEVVTSPNTTYNSQSADFLQQKKGGVVWVNATTIPNTDTVTLISESGKQVTQLIGKRESQINQSELGKTCRLIISNSPTIFYSTEKLKQFVEPVQEEGNSKTENDEKEEAGWAWWYYAILIIGIVIIGFGIWIFIKSRGKGKEPIYAIYKNNNKGLSDFANENGTDLNHLLKWNKEIARSYKSYSTSDKKSVQKELFNKQLIIGYKNKSLVKSNSTFSFDKEKNESATTEWQKLQESNYQPTNFGNNSDLSSQLREMEGNLIRQIERLSSGNSNSSQVNDLRREKAELEGRFKTLETDKRSVDAKASILENNLQNANDEKSRIQKELETLKEKVITADFLTGYSDSVFSYLKYCQQVSSDAYNLFNKISQQNPKQASAAGHLLMKFQSAVNSIPVGDWLRTVQDIKDSGATTYRQLIRSFSQIQNDSDKQKEFQRLLFSEVLTRYSSNILILAEAFKNLSRFPGLGDFASEAQNTFGKHITEIVSRAKSTGLDIKHVPLFESWEKHLGQVEDNGGERSLAYKEIYGLEKGSIAEIVSYGVKTSLGDDTKTIIILA